MKKKGSHAKALRRKEVFIPFFVPLRLCVKYKDIAASRR
jgi:hypothetical protein